MGGSEAAAGWAVAIVAMLGLLYSVRTRGQDMSTNKITEVLKPIIEEQTRFRAHHAQHFDTAKRIENGLAAIDQRMRDHEKHDDDRFENTNSMLKEIRSDIKILIQRSGD